MNHEKLKELREKIEATDSINFSTKIILNSIADILESEALDKTNISNQSQPIPPQETKPWPQDGDKIFFLHPFGIITNDVNSNSNFDSNFLKSFLSQGNLFPTLHLAEMEKLRRESMAARWIPKENEFCFMVMIHSGNIVGHDFNCSWYADILNSILGAVHPTQKAAEAWKEKYWPAFLEVIKSKEVSE